MSAAELLARQRLLLAAAIVLQWLTTSVVALRADDLSLGAVELFNVAVLGPIALACAYRLASRISGVALGAWTLLVFVATPWLVPAFTLAAYDETMRDRALPLALGLTEEPGYAAGVALLASAALLAEARLGETVAAGFAAAVAIVLVPQAVVFLVPVAVALLISWRPRELAAFLAAAAPALLVAALWRTPDFGVLSLDVLRGQFAGLREYFWSQRLLQWLPLAGAIAVARRSVPLALLVGGWFAAWVAIGAARAGVRFEDAGLINALLPALPAYLMLGAALPLLVPTLAARLGPLARPVESRSG
jgi:hypothetical protein